GLSSSYNHTEGGTQSAAHVYGPSSNTEDGYLVSPGLIIPASGYIELSFWSYNVYPGDYVKNSVLISSGSPDPTDGDYIEIWSPASVTASWVQTLLDLSAYHGQTIYIAFRYEGSFAHTWHLDDVSVSVQTPPVKTLNLKAYIQGFWNGTGMNQAYDADEEFNTWPKFTGTTVDTLSVYFADNDTYEFLHAIHEVNLNNDGTMTMTVPESFSGSYYIAIKHRSSVEIWSMNPVDFAENTIAYDFTTSAAQAYGSNQQDLIGDGTVWGLFSGDITSGEPGVQDGWIELPDVNDIYNLQKIGAFGYQPGDLTGDGFVELADLNMAFNNINIGKNTPAEPQKRPGFFKRLFTD
ncbi:choice-of-anchor J domain-containing protein, partial [Lentimicrobium sp.]|uniref:choice-of-anchor J domain-containing protein n=1 Tax=Lentimicrobium sp. TaxID=2034841 RepID=UPI002C5A2F32